MTQKHGENENNGNELPTYKMFQEIVDRAHTEIEFVRKAYYFAGGCIAAIIAVGIFVSYKSLQDIRSDMRVEVELMKSKAKQDYTTLATEMKSSVMSDVQDVRKNVNARIDAEFDNENIKGIVRGTAQKRIDEVADNYIEKHITAKITPKIDAAGKRIKEVENSVDFNAVSSAAINDSRIAFEQLQKWSQDKSFPLRDKASESLKEIIKSKYVPDHITPGYIYPWPPGIDPSKLKMDSIRKQYRSDSLPGFRMSLLGEVSGRKDISKKEKLEFLSEVLRDDKSLDVCLLAADMFNLLSGQKFNRFDRSGILEWYTNHKKEIE